MAVRALRRFGYLFDLTTLLIVGGGGGIVHCLTSLAIGGSYGEPWGCLAFFVPGGAELFLAATQIAARQYNYAIFLGVFLAIALCKGGLWCGKNLLLRRLGKKLAGPVVTELPA
jgi:hypothetical protein